MVSTSEVIKDTKSSEMDIFSSTNGIANQLIISTHTKLLFTMIEVIDTFIEHWRIEITNSIVHSK